MFQFFLFTLFIAFFITLFFALFFAFFLAVSLPGIYVALISYHKEMLPKNLLASIAMSRSAVPFPAAVEMFILLILFYLLYVVNGNNQRNYRANYEW